MIRSTVPCPSSSFSRRTTVGASSRICVAHEVASACTTNCPSSNRIGVQCCATSSPTIIDQRPNTPCTATSVSQPYSETRRPIAASSVCGSRSSGWDPASRGSLRPAVRLRFFRVGRALVVRRYDRARLFARSRPLGSWPSAAEPSSVTGDATVSYVEPATEQPVGNVLGNRRGDHHLFRLRNQRREPITPATI